MAIPSPPEDLGGFPETRLGPPVSLWRVHRHAEPWFFASAGEGRFDLAAPRGTCYASDDPLGAFIEHFGHLIAPGRAIPLASLRARFLSYLTIEGRLRLADLMAREVLGRYGVTAEIAPVGDYQRTRQWGESLADAGFEGIRYPARHDPSGSLRSVALFGAAGANPLGSAATERLPASLIVEAIREFDITVAPTMLG